MAIAFRSSTTASVTGVNVTININVPAGVQVGDVLVVYAVATVSGEFVSAGTVGTNFTNRINDFDSGGGAGGIVLDAWTRVADGTEPASYSIIWNTSTSRKLAWMGAYSGCSATPFDVASTNTGASSTNVVMASLTTANANEMLVAFFSNRSTGTYTPDAAMTERDDFAAVVVNGEAADQTITAAGATGTRTAVSSITGQFVAGGLALIPATTATAQPSMGLMSSS